MAVFTGVVIAGPYSGAHLNPSVTLAFAATGQFPWSDVPGYVLAQMLGGAAGALATWLFYRPHFDLEENPDTIRGVFCTAPAVRNPASNLLSEIIATFVLIFTIFYITEGHLASTEGNVPIGLGSVGALPVALVILVIGGALGGTTGYSLNPAAIFRRASSTRWSRSATRAAATGAMRGSPRSGRCSGRCSPQEFK